MKTSKEKFSRRFFAQYLAKDSTLHIVPYSNINTNCEPGPTPHDRVMAYINTDHKQKTIFVNLIREVAWANQLLK
jgi:hypothetical protein